MLCLVPDDKGRISGAQNEDDERASIEGVLTSVSRSWLLDTPSLKRKPASVLSSDFVKAISGNQPYPLEIQRSSYAP